jgi:hypothetical protein
MDGKIKAPAIRQAQLSGRIEVFGIRREPPGGGSRKSLKNFNGPTAIHAFPREREVFGRWQTGN